MKSKQRWDKDKEGIIGEDEKLSLLRLQRIHSGMMQLRKRKQSGSKVDINTSKKAKIDAKNLVNRDVPGVEDNNTLSSLHTKSGEDEE